MCVCVCVYDRRHCPHVRIQHNIEKHNVETYVFEESIFGEKTKKEGGKNVEIQIFEESIFGEKTKPTCKKKEGKKM